MNARLKAQQLPPEIYTRIIELCLHDLNDGRFSRHYQELMRQRSVCCQWLQQIDGESRFWTFFQADMSEDLVDLALVKSRDSLITINYLTRRGQWPFLATPIGSAQQRLADKFTRRLLPHRERWKTLWISLTPSSTTDRERDQYSLLFHRLPSLQFLKLHDGGDFTSPVSIRRHLPKQTTPNLRNIEIECGLPWALTGSFLRDLTTLSLRYYLDLTPDYHQWQRLSFQQLVGMLQASPGLKTFSLRQFAVVLEPPTVTADIKVFMPELERLYLDAVKPDTLQRLSEILVAPNLYDLQGGLEGGNDHAQFLQGIGKFIGRLDDATLPRALKFIKPKKRGLVEAKYWISIQRDANCLFTMEWNHKLFGTLPALQGLFFAEWTSLQRDNVNEVALLTAHSPHPQIIDENFPNVQSLMGHCEALCAALLGNLDYSILKNPSSPLFRRLVKLMFIDTGPQMAQPMLAMIRHRSLLTIEAGVSSLECVWFICPAGVDEMILSILRKHVPSVLTLPTPL